MADDVFRATGPCGICGEPVTWYQIGDRARTRKGEYWRQQEAATGKDHYENCAGAWNLHLRLNAVSVALRKADRARGK